MKKFLFGSYFSCFLFLSIFINIIFSRSAFSQCINSPCFCIAIDEVGELSISWDTLNISNSNLFEHQFFADTGNGFVQIGTQSNPSINSFDFQNFFAGNASTSYFIKSLYGTNGSNFYFSDTISSIYFDLVNLFDGRVSLSWNHPVQINNIPVNSQYIIEKSSPVNPPTSAIWSPVISLPLDSTNYIDNISVCSSWLNYRVRLITTNCDFVSNLDGGFIEDQQAPDPPIINVVTNDTANNQIKIHWNPSIAQDVMAYIIFKFSSGSWNPLDTIYGIQNTIYYDTAITTFQNNIVQYAIAAMDSCSSGLPPQFNTSSAGSEHNNILLTQNYDQCSGEVALSWNEYINWPNGISNYKIFIKNDFSNNWNLLDSTNSLNYNYTIQQGNSNFSFIIEASSDSLISISNTIEFYANQPPIPQISYISEVNVFSDTIAIKYLGQNGIGIQYLNIFRSVNNGINFELLNTINNPTFPFTYFDTDSNPNESSYVYQFSVIDSCLNEVAFSNYGSSIKLSISSNDYLINKLSWNPYIEWENGVANYEIYYLNNMNGALQPLIVLDSFEINHSHDFSNLINPSFDGRLCYKVMAFENQNSNGINGISSSNTFCIQNDPLVFIPNAIDLRGSINYWKPVISMIDFSDYKVSIYNRHGELISFFDDINQFWDGKVLNSDLTVPMGVYVYQIEFKNPEGKYFHKKGHITLIK